MFEHNMVNDVCSNMIYLRASPFNSLRTSYMEAPLAQQLTDRQLQN